jgi:hypothetical protein
MLREIIKPWREYEIIKPLGRITTVKEYQSIPSTKRSRSVHTSHFPLPITKPKVERTSSTISLPDLQASPPVS